MVKGFQPIPKGNERPTITQRTPSGILFKIPEGISFLYDTRTNRITAQDDLRGIKSRRSSLREDVSLDLGEIKYGFSLDRCIAMFADGIERMTLELTQQCNCRCAYCLYSGAYDNRRAHSDKVMDSQMLLSALRFFKRHNGSCKDAQISFYGGEALLEFPLVRMAVAEATKLFGDKPVSFNISTNGLLLADDVVRWLSENPNVSVAVTLNGPRHDDYRVTRWGKPTLDIILRNVALIRERFPVVWNRQVGFICNVASLSEIRPLRDFYRDVVGKPPLLITGIHADHANASVSRIARQRVSEQIRLWQELANEYMQTGDLFLHALYRSRIRHIYRRPIYDGEGQAIASNCIPFLTNCFVSADGSINLCEKNCAMTLGHVANGIDVHEVRKLMENALAAFNRKCSKCWAQRLCSVCFADMENLLQNDADISEKRCHVERKNIAADLAVFTHFTLFHPELFDRLYKSESNVNSRRIGSKYCRSV